MTTDSAVHMQHISKRFPGVVANDQVTLDVRRGEVHALLGENGAGKSTLMKILYGLYEPDSGKISVGGVPTLIRAPATSIRAGIGMVPQHFILVSPLRVVENVALGLQGAGLGGLRLRDVAREIETLTARYGWHIDPWARVSDLSPGEHQRIEIIKALYRKARILILDEPTSVLTPREADELIKTLRLFVGEGGSVIFISHKLGEVLAVSDRVTVMRDGRVVGTVDAAGATQVQLARMMVGREITLGIAHATPAGAETVLDVRGLNAPGATPRSTLKDVSFTVNRGEVLGIAGVDGNGQNELASVLCGVERHYGGEIRVKGQPLKDFLTGASRGKIAYVPGDRQRQGVLTSMSVGDNLTLRRLVDGNFVLSLKRLRDEAADLFTRYNVKAASLDQPVSQLSGGNQQKVVFARETGTHPDLLVAVQATQGLDIAATEEVFASIARMRAQGVAIVYISTELDELLALSDRIGILSGGQLVNILDRQLADMDTIGLLMGGAA